MKPIEEWDNWESGDYLVSHQTWQSRPQMQDIIRIIKGQFPQAIVDPNEGDRWVEARVKAALDVGYSGILLDAENSLKGSTVHIAINVKVDAETNCCVSFFLTPDTSLIGLHYKPPDQWEACRRLALQLANLLSYEVATFPDDFQETNDATIAPGN